MENYLISELWGVTCTGTGAGWYSTSVPEKAKQLM